MRPRLRACMPGATSWVTRRAARVLILMMEVISSGGVWVKGTGIEWEAPTLLTRIEMSRVSIREASWA